MMRASKRLMIVLGLTVLFQAGVQAGVVGAETIPTTITSFEPRFDQLVPKDARLEKIADGFSWVEGPVWHKQGGYLLFFDIPANRVYKWKPGEGVSLFVKNSGYSGCDALRGQGAWLEWTHA